jgi:hypothetical protein
MMSPELSNLSLSLWHSRCFQLNKEEVMLIPRRLIDLTLPESEMRSTLVLIQTLMVAELA